MSACIDPFGAQEFFCTAAVYEVAAPGIVRVLMISDENGERIVKAKLLLPFAALPACIVGAARFSASQLIGGIKQPEGLLM